MKITSENRPTIFRTEYYENIFEKKYKYNTVRPVDFNQYMARLCAKKNFGLRPLRAFRSAAKRVLDYTERRFFLMPYPEIYIKRLKRRGKIHMPVSWIEL